MRTKLGGEKRLTQKQFERNSNKIRIAQIEDCKRLGHAIDENRYCLRCGIKVERS